jgi:hypothetical protein
MCQRLSLLFLPSIATCRECTVVGELPCGQGCGYELNTHLAYIKGPNLLNFSYAIRKHRCRALIAVLSEGAPVRTPRCEPASSRLQAQYSTVKSMRRTFVKPVR